MELSRDLQAPIRFLSETSRPGPTGTGLRHAAVAGNVARHRTRWIYPQLGLQPERLTGRSIGNHAAGLAPG